MGGVYSLHGGGVKTLRLCGLNADVRMLVVGFIFTLLPGVSLLTQNDDYTKYTSSLGAFTFSLSFCDLLFASLCFLFQREGNIKEGNI